jgi:hypothetical protein
MFLFALNANSQNDTLYLNKDHILLNGIRYNRISEDFKRIGSWINYGIKHDFSISECASGYDTKTYVNCHRYTNVTIKYRQLKDSETEGERIILKEILDTTFNDKRYHIKAEEIHSKIPPEVYYIVSKGMYENGKKSGIWTYFYQSGIVRKVINYNKSIPTESFKIFRENETLMLSAEKISSSKWKISKYSEEGIIIEIKTGPIEEFKKIF